MNLKPIRRYRRRLRAASGILENNPVLALGLALPLAIVPINLKSGVAISAVMLVATLPPAAAAAVVGQRIPAWLRAPVFGLLSMLCVLLARAYLLRYPVLLGELGIYVPLAAVNTILLGLTSAPQKPPAPALRDALAMCVGFALVVCGVSALREIMGNRTIWDLEFGLYPIRMVGVTLPFFGFILLGFLSALFRSINRGITRSMLRRQPPLAERQGERV